MFEIWADDIEKAAGRKITYEDVIKNLSFDKERDKALFLNLVRKAVMKRFILNSRKNHLSFPERR